MLLTSQRITNMFGAVGYSVLLVNYALVAASVLWWLIQSGHGDVLGIPPAQETPVIEELTDAGEPSLILSIFAYAVTIVMLLVVLFVTVTLPYWLGRSGSYMLKRLIRLFVEPLTPAALLLGKIIAKGIVAVPILLIVAEDISGIATLLFVTGLVLLTLVLFLLQHYLARMNGLEAKEIW